MDRRRTLQNRGRCSPLLTGCSAPLIGKSGASRLGSVHFCPARFDVSCLGPCSEDCHVVLTRGPFCHYRGAFCTSHITPLFTRPARLVWRGCHTGSLPGGVGRGPPPPRLQPASAFRCEERLLRTAPPGSFFFTFLTRRPCGWTRVLSTRQGEPRGLHGAGMALGDPTEDPRNGVWD